MKPALFRVLLLVAILFAASIAAADPCAEFFQMSSSPAGVTLGLNNDGFNYGQGQSFTLNCGARLETVAFKVFWGNDVGAVRSLAYGDSIFLSILTADGQELVRQGYMLDVSIGSRTITFSFMADDVLLPVGTYVAAIWTDAPACGGLSYYNADVVTGTRYSTGTPQDWVSWSPASGELFHTIILDSDVTPTQTIDWGGVKAVFR